MSDIYSTAQAAELLGISADTIRTWKRRQTELLLEQIHWFKDDSNALMFTEKGVQVLAQFKSSDVQDSDSDLQSSSSSSDVQSSDHEPRASSTLESRYLPLLDMLANALAPKLQRQLDQKVMGKVKGFATNAQPMTSVECVELLTQLGLKPANPASLLAGQDIQALPSSNQ